MTTRILAVACINAGNPSFSLATGYGFYLKRQRSWEESIIGYQKRSRTPPLAGLARILASPISWKLAEQLPCCGEVCSADIIQVDFALLWIPSKTRT